MDLFKPPSVRPWEDLSEADRPGVQFLDPWAGFPVLGCFFRPRVPSSRVKELNGVKRAPSECQFSMRQILEADRKPLYLRMNRGRLWEVGF